MSVAKPWIERSPASELFVSHWLDGFPVRQFSATIAFAGVVHCPCACATRPSRMTANAPSLYSQLCFNAKGNDLSMGVSFFFREREQEAAGPKKFGGRTEV